MLADPFEYILDPFYVKFLWVSFLMWLAYIFKKTPLTGDKLKMRKETKKGRVFFG